MPILNEALKDRIKATLDLQLADNVQCWELQSTGLYKRLKAPAKGKAVNSQATLAKHYGHAN